MTYHRLENCTQNQPQQGSDQLGLLLTNWLQISHSSYIPNKHSSICVGTRIDGPGCTLPKQPASGTTVRTEVGGATSRAEVQAAPGIRGPPARRHRGGRAEVRGGAESSGRGLVRRRCGGKRAEVVGGVGGSESTGGGAVRRRVAEVW